LYFASTKRKRALFVAECQKRGCSFSHLIREAALSAVGGKKSIEDRMSAMEQRFRELEQKLGPHILGTANETHESLSASPEAKQ